MYTDYILSSVVNTFKKFPELEAVMIYVSEHGEFLVENNIYLHGLPYKIAPDEQTDVPMVVWMSETMKKYDFIDYECLKKKAKSNIYSHYNLFHSVLGLFEVETSEYKKSYDMFFGCRTKVLPYQEQSK